MKRTPLTGWHIVTALVILGWTARSFGDQPVPVIALPSDGGPAIVSGVTPSATVYGFSMARENGIGLVNVVPRDVLLQDSGSGQVEWSLGETIPTRSIWFAADLVSGAYATGAPADYGIANVLTLTDRHLIKTGGVVTQLGADGNLVEFIVVRPGTGVWRTGVSDGGDLDEDSQPNSVAISVANLQPVAGTVNPAPSQLQAGDIVFLVNSYAATYGAARLVN